MEKTMKDIERLKTSDEVVKARDQLMFKEVPTTFHKFERDFKIFKADTDKKVKYLLHIGAENVKTIFRMISRQMCFLIFTMPFWFRTSSSLKITKAISLP